MWGDERFRCLLRACLFPLYISRLISVLDPDFLISIKKSVKILLRILFPEIEIGMSYFSHRLHLYFILVIMENCMESKFERNRNISVYGSVFHPALCVESKKEPIVLRRESGRIGQKVDEFMPSVYVKGRQRGYPFNVGRAGKG